MKIAVMASPRNSSTARSVMVRLEADGRETVGLKFNETWTMETRSRIDALLSGATHALCIADADDSGQSWFAYIIGLARGREMPLSTYAVDEGWQPSPWIADVTVFHGLGELAIHYGLENDAWTVKEGRRTAKATLLELGISWHAESLAQCVRDSDTKAVALFIDSGFPPDVRDKSGVPMLCLATRSRHRSIVELLLDRGADVNAQSDDRGYSALMDAAQQGDQPLLELMLARGAEPNLGSKDGQTALVLAVGRDDAAMVERLLATGADPDIADKLGLSARKYARLFNNPRIAAAFAAT